MKRIYTLSILVAVSFSAHSQKFKYEEELPRILAMPSAGRTVMLKDVQAADPENVSIDFQLATIYEDRYRESDILTEFAYKLGNAQEALRYYNKAAVTVTEKDVKKNDEHYMNFGSYDERGKLQVDYQPIKDRIDAAIPELQTFVDNAPGIYEKFTESFSHYDEAHKLYVRLLGSYTTRNELLLRYNPNVDNTFEKIKEEYLASVDAFKAYKEATAAYPIPYDQELVIEEITTYRLDGLEAEINFLKEEVDIWNYATWVDSTRAYVNAHITDLRNDLVSENTRIKQKMASAESEFRAEQFDPLIISKELLFTLRKFDLASVIEPIFLYKEVEHDLRYQQLLSTNLDTAATMDVDRKLYLYGQMLDKLSNADSLLADINSRNTPASFAKYPDFLDEQYEGRFGIEDMVIAQREKNKSEFEGYVSKIRQMVFEELTAIPESPTATYKGKQIGLVPVYPLSDEELTDQYVTTHQVENFDGSRFVGGIVKDTKSDFTQSFVSGITAEGKVAWVKHYLMPIDSANGPDSHTRIGAMKAVPGGIAIMLNSSNPIDGDVANQLMALDETGTEKLSVRLLIGDFPRKIFYDEQGNSLLVAFKGNNYDADINEQSDLVIAKLNILGDLQWQQRFGFKGDLIDITKVSDGFIFTGNFNELRGLDSKIVRAGAAGQTKVFQFKMAPTGAVTDLQTFDSPQPYYANFTYKVGDNCINILGSTKPYIGQVFLDTNPDSFVHIITNKDLGVLSKSLD